MIFKYSAPPSRTARRAVFCLAGAIFLPSTGGAADVASVRSRGVTAPAAGDSVEPLAKDNGPVVTYAGFRAHDDGSSTIRVDVSESVPVKVEHEGVVTRFFLEGARITIKNNKNPLLAQHFRTNLVSARLIPEKKGVTLELKLRKSAEPTFRVVDHAGGSATVVIDIPGARKDAS